jgi:hypothetical protein
MAAQWDDTNYVTAYIAARDGKSGKDIAAMLGCNPARLAIWRKQRPALEDAIQRGKSSSTRTLTEHILGSVPEDVLHTWDIIQTKHKAASKAGSRVSAAELDMLTGQMEGRQLQHLYLLALASSSWNADRACKTIGVQPYMLQAWRKDPDFCKVAQAISEAKRDFVEGRLLDLVNGGHAGATIFAAKSLVPEYQETRTLKHTGKVDVDVQHTHTLALEDLNLPTDLMLQILEHVDAHKEAQRKSGLLLEGEAVKHDD